MPQGLEVRVLSSAPLIMELIKDLETQDETITPSEPIYKEEVITREYAQAIGVPENLADLVNYVNDLAPKITEIKKAMQTQDAHKVKELLEELESKQA